MINFLFHCFVLRLIETLEYVIEVEEAYTPHLQNESNKLLKVKRNNKFTTFQFVNYLGLSKIVFGSDDNAPILAFEVVPNKMKYVEDYIGLTESLAEICNQIFGELRVLSLFKWHNSKEKLGANFKKLDIMGFTKEFLSDSKEMLNHVNGRSDNSRATLEGLNAFLAANENVDDFYELTNGHDFVLRLCAYMRKHYKKQISESDMECYLQSQLTPAKFKNTDLYSAICKWEDANDVLILKQH